MAITNPKQTVPSQNPQAFWKFSAQNYSNPQLVPPNDNRQKRAWLLRKYYYNQILILLKTGMPIDDVLRHQYPFLLPMSRKPLGLQIEFTNLCNLECKYCTNLIDERPKGYMEERIFDKLIQDIRKYRIRRISVVGNGEPTIHPMFNKYIKKLGEVSHVLSLTSNLQKVNEENISAIAQSVNILNVSVDGINQQTYEKYRHKGSYNRLLHNISLLKKYKKELGSDLKLNIRLMVHPSYEANIKEMNKYWEQYGDIVSNQYVLNFKNEREDVYDFNTDENFHPKCSLPFKKLDIHWDGNVPLCSYYYKQANHPNSYILGNVEYQNLKEIWNLELISHYRKALKMRDKKNMPLCAGCIGC